MDNLKIGILLDSNDINHINSDLVDRLMLSKKVDLKYFLILKDNYWDFSIDKPLYKRIYWIVKSKKTFVFLRKLVLRNLHKIEYRIFFGKPPNKTPLNKYKNVSSIKINSNISESGLVETFENSEIEKIKRLNLDLLIRCNSKILRGDILNVCPFGIISFHHGNNDLYRGSPSAFYEVYNKEPYTGFIIQKLNNELDNGDVFLKGDVVTSKFHAITSNKLHIKANKSMVSFLETLSISKKLPEAYPKIPYSNELYMMPSWKIIFNYSLRLFKNLLKIFFNKLLNKKEKQKKIGFILNTNWRNISLWKANIIKSENNESFSDPCPFKYKDKSYCIINSYKKVNRIRLFELFKKEYSDLGTLIIGNKGNKNPFIFEIDKNLYALVINPKNRSIEVYRCTNFPNNWSYVSSPISGKNFLNGFMIENSKEFWLITTSKDSNGYSYKSVYKSSDLYKNDWHEVSVVDYFCDSNAINSGLAYDDSKIFRFIDFNLYEKGNRLDCVEINLKESIYKEKKIDIKIYPNFKNNINHVNNFFSKSDITVFDFY